MAAMPINPGERVLDIGCGSGVVSLAAACRTEGATVLAIDRTLARWNVRPGAERNGLANVTVELAASGPRAAGESFDVAVANPPYYAGLRMRVSSWKQPMRRCGRAEGSMW